MQPTPNDEQPMTDPLGPFYGPPPPPPPPRRPGGRVLPLLIVAVLAAAAGAGTVIGLRGNSTPSVASPGTPTPSTSAPSSAGSTPSGSTPTTPSAAPSSVPGAAGIPVPAASTPAGASGALNAQAVSDKVQPGMVNISAPEAYGQNLSEGTGIILTSTGLVVTNNHVIEGATSPTATLVGSG